MFTCLCLCGAVAFVQVLEYLLIPGFFEHPRRACVNLCLYNVPGILT